jgi:hypothetical protein
VFEPLADDERHQLAELMARVMESYWAVKLEPPRRRA